MYWNSRDRFKGTRGEKVSQANVDSKMTFQMELTNLVTFISKFSIVELKYQ